MIHLSVGPAMSGNPAAKTQLGEGLSHIQQAIAINPAAHFGASGGRRSPYSTF